MGCILGRAKPGETKKPGGKAQGLVLKVGLDKWEDVSWELLVLGDGEGPRDKHFASIAGGVQAGVVEVLDHGPRLPSPHKAGMERINACPEEGHAPPTAESPDTNVTGRNAASGSQSLAAGA